MFRFDDVRLRRFEKNDIKSKINWINNEKNNEFLHYDLPLTYEKTFVWFNKNIGNDNRFDAVIEYNNIPVGLVGLINIDYKNKKAEDYMIIGETKFKGKGIGTKAGILNAIYCFKELHLNKLIAYIEVGNHTSMKLDRKRGFRVEGYLRNDLFCKGQYVDRHLLAQYSEDFVMPKNVFKDELFY